MARVTTRAGRVLPQLLRERRDFRRFWTGQTISLFGDQVTLLALPLVGVLVLHASPAQMGYLAAAGLAPNLLLSLHAGAWVDRHGRRRRIMIAADLGRAGLLATVPLAYALGVLTLDQLYAVAFLAGALSVLFFVSRETLFVSVAPRDRFVEANSLLYGSRAFSFVGGPSLGGLLVQLLSAPARAGSATPRSSARRWRRGPPSTSSTSCSRPCSSSTPPAASTSRRGPSAPSWARGPWAACSGRW